MSLLLALLVRMSDLSNLVVQVLKDKATTDLMKENDDLRRRIDHLEKKYKELRDSDSRLIARLKLHLGTFVEEPEENDDS